MSQVTHQKIRGLLTSNGIRVGHWWQGKVIKKFIGNYEVSKWIGNSVMITAKNKGSFGDSQSRIEDHPIVKLLILNGYVVKRYGLESIAVESRS